MKINPDEITAIIKDQIKNYNVDLNVDEVGTVIEVGTFTDSKKQWRASCWISVTIFLDWS